MAEISVTSRDGVRSTLNAVDGRLLMEALRDANFGVDGTCGGMCSCGTCHVYIDASWSERLPPRSEDEQMMLDAIGELVEVRPTSRLSCQIRMDKELSGLKLEVGPVA
jgi:2Fe-2S ferredoxin